MHSFFRLFSFFSLSHYRRSLLVCDPFFVLFRFLMSYCRYFAIAPYVNLDESCSSLSCFHGTEGHHHQKEELPYRQMRALDKRLSRGRDPAQMRHRDIGELCGLVEKVAVIDAPVGSKLYVPRRSGRRPSRRPFVNRTRCRDIS